MATAIRANEEIARRVITDVWSAGDIDAVDELYAEDCVVHDPQVGTLEGRDAVKSWVTESRETFSDTQVTVGEIFSCEGHACGMWSMTGKHTGALPGMDVPATGKTVSMEGLFIARIEDGMITEEWGMGDSASLMDQLGVFDR